MGKTVKILVFVSIFSLFLFGNSSLFAKELNKGEVGTMSQPASWQTFEASWMIGHRVYSPFGEVIGQIDNLMIDRANGRIALVILSGVQGFGAEYVAAPFSALGRTGEDTFQLNFGVRYMAMTGTPYDDPYRYQLYIDSSTVGLFTIPSKIDPLWADSVYRFYGQKPYWTEGRAVPPDIMVYRTAGPSILNSLIIGKTAPVLMGATVQPKDGQAEVRIDDLVIDSTNGRIAFLVVDRVPGRGNLEVSVPFGEMSMKDNAFGLNTTGKKLGSAPSFDQYSDMNNLKWAENVYRFFGQQPYWTEGRTR